MLKDGIDLRSVQVFANLTQETRDDIRRLLIQREYPAGVLLFLEGEECEAVYFIINGEVCIFRSGADGKEQVLARLSDGQAFNTVPPVHTLNQNPASARTLTSAALLALRSQDYRDLLRNHADFCYAVLEDFAGRLVHLTHMIENLSLHSVRGRLARFLIEQADRGEISRRWTQDEIADTLGSVRDVIGRTLRAFEDEHLIRRKGSRIALLDRPNLEKISEE